MQACFISFHLATFMDISDLRFGGKVYIHVSLSWRTCDLSTLELKCLVQFWTTGKDTPVNDLGIDKRIASA